MNLKRDQAFTLVELMIVVAIVGVLSAIAYPSYQTHVHKLGRAEAKTALEDIAMKQEAYFAINNRYATLVQLGMSNPYVTENTKYSITVTLSNSTVGGITVTNGAYSLTAAATGGQTSDTTCASIALNSKGVKSATNTTKCWG